MRQDAELTVFMIDDDDVAQGKIGIRLAGHVVLNAVDHLYDNAVGGGSDLFSECVIILVFLTVGFEWPVVYAYHHEIVAIDLCAAGGVSVTAGVPSAISDLPFP